MRFPNHTGDTTRAPALRRRTLLGAAALGAASVPLAACGSDSGSGRLRILNSMLPEPARALLDDYAREFEDANEGVQVEITYVPWENHRTTILSALSAGNLPDIVHSGSAQGAVEFSQSGAFLDASELFDSAFLDRFVPGAFDEIGHNGIPLALSPETGIWYFKDAFEEAGLTPPPVDQAWAWEEFTDAAVQLTQGDRWGFIERGEAGLGMQKALIPYAWSYGTDFLVPEGDDWVSGIGTAEMEQAVQTYVDLVRVHQVRPESYLSWGHAEGQRAWADRTTAMYSSGMWWNSDVTSNTDDVFGEDYDVMLFPTDDPDNRKVYVSYDYFHITRDAADPELAADFLTFLYEKERLVELATLNYHNPPMIEEALADERYSPDEYPIWGSRYSQWLDLIQPLPTHIDYGKVSVDMAVPVIQGLVQSGDEVGPALAELDEQVNAEIA